MNETCEFAQTLPTRTESVGSSGMCVKMKAKRRDGASNYPFKTRYILMVKKKFLKTKCKATFELPEGIREGVETAYIVGDFNNWDEQSTPMEKKRGNRFTIELDLDLNREYQYRFLLNGKDWHNDWEADKYVPNPFSGDNSVVTTYPDGHSK